MTEQNNFDFVETAVSRRGINSFREYWISTRELVDGYFYSARPPNYYAGFVSFRIPAKIYDDRESFVRYGKHSSVYIATVPKGTIITRASGPKQIRVYDCIVTDGASMQDDDELNRLGFIDYYDRTITAIRNNDLHYPYAEYHGHVPPMKELRNIIKFSMEHSFQIFNLVLEAHRSPKGAHGECDIADLLSEITLGDIADVRILRKLLELVPFNPGFQGWMKIWSYWSINGALISAFRNDRLDIVLEVFELMRATDTPFSNDVDIQHPDLLVYDEDSFCEYENLISRYIVGVNHRYGTHIPIWNYNLLTRGNIFRIFGILCNVIRRDLAISLMLDHGNPFLRLGLPSIMKEVIEFV